MSKRLKLSVGLIVKNEEKNLEKCLIALQPLLKGISSELIIADTGSTDKTKKIASRYTEQVYDFQWCDDFSKARNFVLEKAEGEWFLSIDADEWLDRPEPIIEFINSKEASIYNDVRIIVRNYHTYNGNEYSDNYVKRLFKMLPGRKFVGIIHETVPEIGKEKYIDVYLHHYGYVLDENKFGMSKKSSRNTPLLLKDLEKDPDNLQMMYQLAQEYAVQNDIESLEKICEHIISKFRNKKNDYYVIDTCWFLNEVYKRKRDYEKIVKSAEPYIVEKEGRNLKVLDVIAQALDALFELKNYKKAKKFYKVFFELINECQRRSKKGESGFSACVSSLKAEEIEKREYYYSYILYQCKEYRESFLYLKRIKGLAESGLLENNAGLWRDILNETEKYDEIKDYYAQMQEESEQAIEYIQKLILYIWNNDRITGKNIAVQLSSIDKKDEFVRLQEIYLQDEEGEEFDSSNFQSLMSSITPKIQFEGLLKIAIKRGLSVAQFINRCTSQQIYSFARVIGVHFTGQLDMIMEACLTEGDSGDVSSIKTTLFYAKVKEALLFDVHLTDYQIKQLFLSYIQEMDKYNKFVYRPELLSAKFCEVLPDECSFVVYASLALQRDFQGKLMDSLKYYKKALRIGPAFSKILKVLTQDIKTRLEEANEAKKQFDDYGKRVKKFIRTMIESGDTGTAEEALSAYEKVNPGDPEIGNLKELFVTKGGSICEGKSIRKKIYIRTRAYNAEKTLQRTVESVLNQTYGDFVYYLCDNGSTDGTRKIVEEYARKDSRIRPFYNTVNGDYKDSEEYQFLPQHLGDEDYYCTLDADDEYDRTFFEEMIRFMEEYNLDIAVCGSNFLNVEQNNKLIRQRKVDSNLIIEGDGFKNYFPVYHEFLRTTWGKVFKGKTIHNTVQDDKCKGYPRGYGGDTYNAYIAFGDAERVGIYEGTLHQYYVSKKSASYQFNPWRAESDQILHEAGLNYLKKFGEMTLQNQDFLFIVYLYALKDTLDVLLPAKIADEEKIDYLYHMCINDYSRQLAAKKDLGYYISTGENPEKTRRELFISIGNWLLSVHQVPDKEVEKYCDTGEFVCAASNSAKGWISFRKNRIQFLIDENRTEEAADRMRELKQAFPGLRVT